ncbi:MAG TPA: hypothetical protein VN329_05100 [Roseomonas sp.]|nr:hypothetical protein [Roseomonas sp.]
MTSDQQRRRARFQFAVLMLVPLTGWATEPPPYDPAQAITAPELLQRIKHLAETGDIHDTRRLESILALRFVRTTPEGQPRSRFRLVGSPRLVQTAILFTEQPNMGEFPGVDRDHQASLLIFHIDTRQLCIAPTQAQAAFGEQGDWFISFRSSGWDVPYLTFLTRRRPPITVAFTMAYHQVCLGEVHISENCGARLSRECGNPMGPLPRPPPLPWPPNTWSNDGRLAP